MRPHQKPVMPRRRNVVLAWCPLDDASHVEGFDDDRVVTRGELTRPESIDLSARSQHGSVLVPFPLIEVPISASPVLSVLTGLLCRLLHRKPLTTNIAVSCFGIRER